MIKENILDERFEGKSIRIKVMGYNDVIEGVVDEVAKYEIGISVRGRPMVVFRHAILYVETEAPEIHGYGSRDLEDTVLTSDFVGESVEVHLLDGSLIKGKLMKVSKYEIGVRSSDRTYIVPKSSISFILFE